MLPCWTVACRNGTMLFELANPVGSGDRRYSWDQKVVISLQANELSSILAEPDTEHTFYHDTCECEAGSKRVWPGLHAHVLRYAREWRMAQCKPGCLYGGMQYWNLKFVLKCQYSSLVMHLMALISTPQAQMVLKLKMIEHACDQHEGQGTLGLVNCPYVLYMFINIMMS